MVNAVDALLWVTAIYLSFICPGCALDVHSLWFRCAVQMMGGDTARAKPRIDIAIPMALVSKSVKSELNRPGAKAETLHG